MFERKLEVPVIRGIEYAKAVAATATAALAAVRLVAVTIEETPRG